MVKRERHDFSEDENLEPQVSDDEQQEKGKGAKASASHAKGKRLQKGRASPRPACSKEYCRGCAAERPWDEFPLNQDFCIRDHRASDNLTKAAKIQ